MTHSNTEKPLVYSCSGCSNVAQLANDIALWLRDRGVADMSCIAGVGGDVKQLVRVATSGRPILALDGCPLNCVKNCLKRHGVEPTWHIQLSDLGIKKRDGVSCSLEEMFRALEYTHQVLGIETTLDYNEKPPGLACNDAR